MSTTREQLLRAFAEENRTSNVEGVLFFQALAERSGMNLTDMLCITILTSTGPITAGQLAEMAGLTTGAITGVVNRLERAGYVRREKDPVDARRVIIQPVLEELERVGAGFFGSQDAVTDTLLADFDDEQLAILLKFMRKANVMTREGIGKLRSSTRGETPGEFTTPLGAVERGRLVFANGVSRLTVRAASGMDDLYRARFEGTQPEVRTDGGTVTFKYPGGLRNKVFGWHNRSGTVEMNDAVPWEIEVRGGAWRVEADLGGIELMSFTLKGGMSDCVLTLPEPVGAVPVRITGGANSMHFHRPAGTQARLSMRGGAARLMFDDQRFDGVGGTVQLQSPGYSDAENRYEIEISGGANEITIQ